MEKTDSIYMIKAVLFDYGGTLDSNGIAWKEHFQEVYLKCRISVKQEVFDRAFYDADDFLPTSHNLKGLGLEETLRLQIGDFLVNLNMRYAQDTPTRALSLFLSDCRASFAKNIPILEKLRRKYRLGIVSNFYGNLAAVLKSEGLDKYFDAVADSSVVGVTKPDPKLFMHALDRLGASPAEAVMVGDSVKRDMAGAAAMGMPHALLWGDRFAHGNPIPCCARDIILKDLSELPDRIAALDKEGGKC